MATVPINTDIYQFGQWAQPNQRNIGDSLLDLYRMKREIEKDKMDREEARMNLDLKKIAMQESLERAKQEREGQKKLADLFEVRPQVSPASSGAYKKGMGTAADMANAAMRIAGGMFGAGTPNTLPAIQPSFPVKQMMQGVTERAMTPKTANLQDPQIQAQLLQIFANMPSKAGAVDDLIRATMRPESTALTAEQRMAELKYKADTKKALEDARAQVTREIVKMKQEGKSTLDKEHQERALTMALTVLNRGGEIKEALAYIQAYLKPQVTSGMLNGQPVQAVVIGNRAYPIVQGQGTPYQMPSSQTPSISPFTPTEGPVPEPAGAGAPPAAPAAGPNAASMQGISPDWQADRDAARAASGSQTLYSETGGTGTAEPGLASGTPPMGTEVPQTDNVLRPMPPKTTGLTETQKVRSIQHIQDRYNKEAHAYNEIAPIYKALMTQLQEVIRDRNAGLPMSPTRAEQIRINRAKILDPDSIVRESEVYRYMQSMGWLDVLEEWKKRATENPEFTALQAENVMREMSQQFSGIRERYDNETAGFRQELEAIGLSGDSLVVRQSIEIPGLVQKAPGKPPKVPAGWSEPTRRQLKNGMWVWTVKDAQGKTRILNEEKK